MRACMVVRVCECVSACVHGSACMCECVSACVHGSACM